MKLIKKLHFHPKEVKITKDIKEREQKQAHGHYFGKKWYPQGGSQGK